MPLCRQARRVLDSIASVHSRIERALSSAVDVDMALLQRGLTEADNLSLHDELTSKAQGLLDKDAHVRVELEDALSDDAALQDAMGDKLAAVLTAAHALAHRSRRTDEMMQRATVVLELRHALSAGSKAELEELAHRAAAMGIVSAEVMAANTRLMQISAHGQSVEELRTAIQQADLQRLRFALMQTQRLEVRAGSADSQHTHELVAKAEVMLSEVSELQEDIQRGMTDADVKRLDAAISKAERKSFFADMFFHTSFFHKNLGACRRRTPMA